VAVIALSDLRYQPESGAPTWTRPWPRPGTPRAFDGDTAVRVILDEKDLAHVIVLERWETESHDAAYQAWRAGPGPGPTSSPKPLKAAGASTAPPSAPGN
jgi:hypothetical protein